jgi:geranylgeranyl reductase
MIHYRDGTDRNGPMRSVRTRAVVGADGARSRVATQSLENPEQVPCVFAYHEIIRSPENNTDKFEKDRCDVYYQGKLSPDFYGWVFPHGKTTSVGTGSAIKGFSLRGAIHDLRKDAGLDGLETIRREGAPIPLKTAPEMG